MYVCTEDEEQGGWEKDVGLSEGVDMRDVLWSLMSGSSGALLDACMAMVGFILLCSRDWDACIACLLCASSSSSGIKATRVPQSRS